MLTIWVSVSQANAQSKDLYLVFNEATWCKYCKAHGERIHALIDQYALDNDVLVINNDVTDEETRGKSQSLFEKLGIQSYMQYRKGAAEVFVFDGTTAQIVDKFPIKLDSDKILQRLDKALVKVQKS